MYPLFAPGGSEPPQSAQRPRWARAGGGDPGKAWVRTGGGLVTHARPRRDSSRSPSPPQEKKKKVYIKTVMNEMYIR